MEGFSLHPSVFGPPAFAEVRDDVTTDPSEEGTKPTKDHLYGH